MTKVYDKLLHSQMKFLKYPLPIHKNFFSILVLVFIGHVSPVFAQQDKDKMVFTITLNNANLKDFIEVVESQSPYRFYFRDSDFDTFFVTITEENKPLEFYLAEIFKNTPYYYAIDSQHNIFLTKNIAISTQLFTDVTNSSADPSNRSMVVREDEYNRIAVLNERRVFTIGNKSSEKVRARISGTVKSMGNGEPIVGASITVQNTLIGTATDEQGNYSLELPTGKHVLIYRSIGMKNATRTIVLYSDGRLNIEMVSESANLNEVTVSSSRESFIKGLKMGVEKMDIQTIKYIPSSFGEVDVLKAMLTVPGVKTVGEASSGFNVRGGATDQNLILFNNSTIYNPFHFFGFFSSFNAETVKSVELYKSAIPARYGGRLSSVLKVESRSGDMQKYKGSFGLGLLTTRVNVEGPIIKDRLSFLFGGRTTYSNWIFNLLPDDSNYRGTKASFYDMNFMLTGKVNDKNTVSLSGYLSHDESNLSTDTLYGYSNGNISIRWSQQVNSKLLADYIMGYDHYGYGNKSTSDPGKAYELIFAINQLHARVDYNFELNSAHTLNFGMSSIYYNTNPGTYLPIGVESQIAPAVVEYEQGLESAIFIDDEFEITDRFSVSAGLRYSVFNYLGDQTVNEYAPNAPRTQENIIRTRKYGKNEIIKTHHGPEVRASARYAISENFSIKASYNTLRQYIHMLSNTVAISPTDTWKLSDPNIKPQFSTQYSIGVYNTLFKSLQTSVEVYSKKIENYLDYKSGAILIMNNHVETDLMTTRGKAYGAEFMLKKPTGKLNGWISYTYSRILLKMDDPIAGEFINRGEYYPASYDKPHDFNLTLNQKITRRFSISLNSAYSTGRPVTIPIGVFYYGGSPKTLYSDRNGYRIPDYFRTDFSVNVEGSHKLKQWVHTSWTFGIYNITGRKNPYSVFYTSENGVINGYKLSIFGTLVPFINFNFRF